MGISLNLMLEQPASEAIKSLASGVGSGDDIANLFTALFTEGIHTKDSTATIRAFKGLTKRDTLTTFLEDEVYFRAITRIIAHFHTDMHTTMDYFDPETHRMLIENPSLSDDIVQIAALGKVADLSEITPELLAETLKVEPSLRSGVL